MLYYLLERNRQWLDERGLYRFLRPLDQDEFRVLAALLLAFILVLLFGKRVIRELTRMKVGDAGMTDVEALAGHAGSKKNTPTMGGVLIAGAILVVTLLLADVRQFIVLAGLVVLVWMAVLGGVDDWLKLTAARRNQGRQGMFSWEKLVFQIGVGLIVGWFLAEQAGPAQPMMLALNIPFMKTYDAGEIASHVIFIPKWLFIIATVIMIAGLSNAVNLTDGMDGLAVGITSAVAFGILVLAMIAGSETWSRFLLVPNVRHSEEVAVIAGAMVGACLGFLWWNCSPAQVFMGDTGALCLGGLIGYMAVVLRQEFVVLFMSGVFLLELGSVVLQVGYFKLTRGKRIFKCAPIHHHFHISGWSEQKIVARAWILSLVLVVVGLATIKLR